MPLRYSQKYEKVSSVDDDVEREKVSENASCVNVSRFPYGFIWLFTITTIVILLSIAAFMLSISSSLSESPCKNPTVRKEWRSATEIEQSEYIAAVLCLHKTPSALKWDNAAKRSDDFPWIHAHNPPDHHRTVNFLPWHRYFIHLYEKALQESCGYQGHLMYWDWTLDYQNLSQSPVFDSEHGFGGDGDPAAEPSISGGSGIRDGPFDTYEVRLLGEKIIPHCLSRGFGRLFGGNFSGTSVSPENIEALSREHDYFEFLKRLEGTVDNDLPLEMGGDWVLASPPNDPFFFLYHTQVYRLWWIWQQEDPQNRLMQYKGPDSKSNSKINQNLIPSLDDYLPPPLGDGTTIREIMNTESHGFCYRY